MRRLAVLLVAITLVGCTGAERTAEDTRAAATQLVANVAAQEYVGVTIGPIVTCAVDNASEAELESLVDMTLAEGMTGRVNQRILALLRRSSTQGCIRAAGIVLPR